MYHSISLATNRTTLASYFSYYMIKNSSSRCVFMCLVLLSTMKRYYTARQQVRDTIPIAIQDKHIRDRCIDAQFAIKILIHKNTIADKNQSLLYCIRSIGFHPYPIFLYQDT